MLHQELRQFQKKIVPVETPLRAKKTTGKYDEKMRLQKAMQIYNGMELGREYTAPEIISEYSNSQTRFYLEVLIDYDKVQKIETKHGGNKKHTFRRI